jgi:UDP-glucose 4-epimerase
MPSSLSTNEQLHRPYSSFSKTDNPKSHHSIVKALDLLLNGGKSRQLNLGTGRGWSVREVLQTVEAAGGRQVPAQVGPRRAGDPPVLVAQARLAGEVLGWEPQVSDLRSIVETAWRWHEAHRAGR